MNDLLHREYYGWENKYTWLVHLHMSNEHALFLEIAQLVRREPNDGPAARLVEMWVKVSITNWMIRFTHRIRAYDASIGLLAWDLLGSALEYTAWNDLVAMLAGSEVITNVFTMTLLRCIQQSQLLRMHIEAVLRDASSSYAVAESLQAWFDALLADWVDRMALGRHVDVQITKMFDGLMQNVYGLIFWEHVARVFRANY
jgi:hypothetical protein